MSNTKKFVVVAAAAFAFAFSATIASAVSATAIYTPASGYLQVGSGMGAKAYQAPYVVSAQTALNACVPGTALVLDGKYGPLTMAKFKAFQAMKNIAQDGIIGPVTANQLAACSGNQPTPSNPSNPSSGLQGGAGSVDSYDNVSSIGNEEVGEDQEDVQVLGVEVEVDDSSDINLTAARLVFVKTSNGAGSSDDFEDYASEVSIWLGDEEVARLDADEFNDNNDFEKTVSFDEDAVIKAGDTENLYVAVSGISNLDSDDEGETWTVDLDQVRFEDADGAIISDEPGTSVSAETFTFETFATANDVELKVSLANDNPDAGSVEADDGDSTDDVVLLIGEFEAEGSDIEIKEVPVTIVSSGSDVDEIAASFDLVIDGDVVASLDADEGTNTDYDSTVSESADCAGTSCTLTFDDIDFVVNEGDTVEFEVRANINEIDGTTVTSGDSLTAKVTASAIDAIDAEDEVGEDLGTNELTGSAIGDAQSFYATGLAFELVSTSAAVTTTGDASATTPTSDVGTYTIKFKLTAFGDDLSVNRACEEGGSDAADQGVEYVITNAGSNSTVCSMSSTADDNSDDTGAAWLLEEGQTETFTLTVAATASADHFAKVYLESINYDETTTDTTPDQYFTSGLGEEDTSTNEIFLNDN